MNDAYVISHRAGMTLAGARAVADAAVGKALDIGVPQCIAVVDDAGDLLAFARMDGARPGSIPIAITKARSAARRRRPTAQEAGGDVAASIRLALAAELDVTGIAGGLPIAFDGHTIGAVGVSSGTSEQDLEVAQAGIDALFAPQNSS